MGYNRLMDAINFNKLTPAQAALLARIRHKIATDGWAVNRALIVLFGNQTADEQRDSTTRYHNLRGFNSADASRGSKLARIVMKGEKLYLANLEKARRLVGKYWRQLLVAALAKQESLPRAA